MHRGPCCGRTAGLPEHKHQSDRNPSIFFHFIPQRGHGVMSRRMQHWPVTATQQWTGWKLIFICLLSNSAAAAPAWWTPQMCCQSVAGLQISRATASRLSCTQQCHRQMGRCLISGCRPLHVLRESDTSLIPLSLHNSSAPILECMIVERFYSMI